MPRKLRLEYSGACYHVINRGNYRRDVFAGEGAAESFQACLWQAAERFQWRLHAFVVMRNHFHLAVETPEPNLSDGMKWLQGTWAMRFNRLRAEKGRPFQGRYKAIHVEPGHALAQVAHYIHLNPLRARVVTGEKLGDYRWSSLPHLAGRSRPASLVPATVLAESGGLPDTPSGWRRYVDYLALLAEEDPRKREERFGRLSRGWAIGSGEFKAGLRQQLTLGDPKTDRFALLGSDGKAQREMRAEAWEEALQVLARGWRINLATLPRQKSAPDKVRLAAALKAVTSVSNGWLAERLAMGQAASVSQYIRRFRLSGGNQTAAFQAGLSRVKT